MREGAKGFSARVETSCSAIAAVVDELLCLIGLLAAMRCVAASMSTQLIQPSRGKLAAQGLARGTCLELFWQASP